MNRILPSSLTIRITALGCGQNLTQDFMGAGSSGWLHSISVLYDRETIDSLSTDPETPYVSVERVRDVLSNLRYRENIVDVVVSAALATENERHGRLNHYAWAMSVKGLVTSGVYRFPSGTTRQIQEFEISHHILKKCDMIRKANTRVVYPGSFNPMHGGHVGVIRAVFWKYSAVPPILDISTSHPDKGVVSDSDTRVDNCRVMLKEHSLNEIPVMVSPCPKFVDKYFHYKTLYPGKDIIFLIGDDVWTRYGESFKMEWEFGGIKDAQFLVMNRGENIPPRERHAILHPASWTHRLPDETLSIRSTDIRNEMAIK